MRKFHRQWEADLDSAARQKAEFVEGAAFVRPLGAAEPANGHEPPATGPLFALAHAVEHAAQLERDAEMIREKLLMNPGTTLTPQAFELLRGAAQSAMHAAFAMAKLVDMVEPPLTAPAQEAIVAEMGEAEEQVVREHDAPREGSLAQFQRAQREGTTIGHQWPTQADGGR